MYGEEWGNSGNVDIGEHAARNDQALDLRGPLEDIEDFSVAEPLGDQLLALAILAGRGKLDGGGGDFHDQRARVSLAH